MPAALYGKSNSPTAKRRTAQARGFRIDCNITDSRQALRAPDPAGHGAPVRSSGAAAHRRRSDHREQPGGHRERILSRSSYARTVNGDYHGAATRAPCAAFSGRICDNRYYHRLKKQKLRKVRKYAENAALQ